MGAENEAGAEAAFQKTIKPLEAPINILIRAFFWEAGFRLVYLTRQTGRKGKNICVFTEVFIEYSISISETEAFIEYSISIFFEVFASFGYTSDRLPVLIVPANCPHLRP